jgi:2-polyprenyl-3-methyl-5-hydroxy-6-metoxy-1,4-benzoquinol methylase
MESLSCPVSNSQEFVPWLTVSDRFDVSQKMRWQLVQSCTSGLVILNPRPDSSEIASYYQSPLYDPFLQNRNIASLKERAYLAARSLLLRYRARLILGSCLKPVKTLSVLEIGSSTGDLLNFFHRSGVQLAHLAGVEPDSASAAHAREHFGLTISPSLKGVKGNFDRIVLWHTLEHIHDLRETIRAVTELLEPDGLLVLALPNPACAGAKHYRENWIAYDAPRHLYHFMPGTVAKLLEPYGLSIVKQQPYFPDAVYNSINSEELACRANGKPFTIWRMASALCRGTFEAGTGILWPGEGAGVVYFATLRPKAFSS